MRPKARAESAISFAQEAIALSRGNQLFLIADLGHAYATAGKKDEAMVAKVVRSACTESAEP